MDAPLERALTEERLRSARIGLALRAGASLAYLAHALILGLIVQFPSARAVIPASVVYAVGAFAIWRIAHGRERLLRFAMYTVPLFDLPVIFYAVSRAMTAASPEALRFQAGVQIGTLLLFLIAVQLALHQRLVLITAVIGVALEALLIVRAGLAKNPQVWANLFIIVGSATVIARYVPGKLVAILRRVVSESEARVREVQALNDELRRQIGDRASQLASALARLEAADRERQELQPGALVGERYRVVRHLGTGGMGAVHEVERLSDGKRLALKVLTGGGDRSALARFAREAQLAARLDHPNVVAIADVDVAPGGMLYLVMELVAGASLEEARPRFGDARWAAPLLQQIGAGLSAMHAAGIVHRDLKPSNVLVTGGEAGQRAKIADLGIAALVERQPPIDDATPDPRRTPARLTRTGALAGTPGYMAPELQHGLQSASPASDVFSFGVLAFELFTRRLPHSSAPVLDRLAGRAHLPPARLREARPDLPPALAELVDACLADDPAARPGAHQLAESLARFALDELPDARPPEPSPPAGRTLPAA